MKKCALALLLALVLVFSLFPSTAKASELDNGLYYTVCEDHVEITKYFGSTEKVVVPAEIEDLPVTVIGNYAFWECVNLRSIELPDSITSIGECAFTGCYNLTDISLPNGITSIGERSFSGCFALTVIDLPDAISSIGDSAFSDCSNLTDIDLPDGITHIGNQAFSGCYNLTGIDLPDSVSSIGEGVFDSCLSLTGIHVDDNNPHYSSDERGVLFDKEKIQLIQAPGAISDFYNIPDSVTKVGSGAFFNCDLLTSVFFPDSVISIGDRAFGDCEALRSIDLPVSVAFIGEDAFDCCFSMTGIHVDRDNPYYSSDDRGILFDKGKTRLLRSPGAITEPYTIPDSVISIEDHAFSFCVNLTGIGLPDGIASIGEGAFRYCRRLTAISLPDSITSIGEWVFESCTRLTDISLPDSITSISSGAFSYCESLTSISLPDRVASIGYYAFLECSSLTSVSIPDSLISVGERAFCGCTSLFAIDLPESITAIGDYAFTHCSNLTDVRFTGDAPLFGYNVFNNVTATAYYPAGNPTWTEHVMRNSGGEITWIPYTPNPFPDVPAGSFYEAPVLWALENGITTGTSGSTFSPNGQCLRAQVVTFLHRAAENPESASTKNPFSDVKPGDFFYKSVLWAVEKGITTGVSADRFGSYDVCNRAAVVTFLWRAAGCPEPKTTKNPFKDVKPADWYYKAVLWAAENGITQGVTATEFGPAANCNRAQVVTFLYRANT